MGRIKTTLTKRTAISLFSSNKEAFQKDFESNKKIVTEKLDTGSKKLRNIIAGYITRLANKKE
ncbi:MAG: 30S ribosomal protein S17e [Nanoarchaeota archaeon]